MVDLIHDRNSVSPLYFGVSAKGDGTGFQPCTNLFVPNMGRCPMLICFRAVGPTKVFHNETKAASTAPKARDIPAWGEAPGNQGFNYDKG